MALLLTLDNGKKAIQCDLIEEARTFGRYITLNGDWYSVEEIVEREAEGDYLVMLEETERPDRVAPDRTLYITGDAKLEDQN